MLGETLALKTSDAAYAKIRTMLATLEDPFTRIVSPQVRLLFCNVGSMFLATDLLTFLGVQEYASFRINNEGALEGVGLLIGSDRDSGRLVRNQMHGFCWNFSLSSPSIWI